MFYLIDIHYMVPGAPKKMYYPVLSPELEAMFTKCRYKFCNLISFIWLRRKIKNINISLKFIMLTDNNQIFRNCFVIIYCHLTKVPSQINKRIIFEPNDLSKTQSTLWFEHLMSISLCVWLSFRFLLFITIHYRVQHFAINRPSQPTEVMQRASQG